MLCVMCYLVDSCSVFWCSPLGWYQMRSATLVAGLSTAVGQEVPPHPPGGASEAGLASGRSV